MAQDPSIEFSWWRRQQQHIAQGALTNSKRPQSFVYGVYPTHLIKGEGATVIDVQGNRYLDFICGLGTNFLGYGFGPVNDAVISALNGGLCLSLSSTLEVEFAEKLKAMFPFIEKMKILKTGTEACIAAVRIARAATGRAEILSEGYHGHGDEFIGLMPPHYGVYPNSHMQKLNDLSDVKTTTAAVIVEPILTDASQKRIEWLRELREKCNKTGTLLIFDEVITGVRYLSHSVSREYAIYPDLICLGKALANGMPIAVVAGKKEVMECCEYFVSSTYAGDRASLAAAIATMDQVQQKYRVKDLWPQGERFINLFNAIKPEKLRIEGYATRGVFVGDDLFKALFFQEACRAGLLFGASWFFNHHHVQHIESIFKIINDIFSRIDCGAVSLLGDMPKSPFAQKMRGK